MARIGSFDPTILPRGWFEKCGNVEGLFGEDFIRKPSGSSNKILPANENSLTLSGSVAGLLKSSKLVAQEVQLHFSGATATLKANRVLSGSNNTLSYTGGTASLKVSRRLLAEPGSLVLLGQDAVTKKHYLLSAEPSNFALTGALADFNKSGATTRVGRVTWTEFEVPEASTNRVGKVTWVEFETPPASTARQGRLTWVELETPSASIGIQVRIFRRIAKARSLGRIARLNYTLVNLGGGLYNVTTSSGVSADLVNSISYEGYEFL